MAIKSKANNIKIILFVVIYSAACFITSKNIEGNIFYYNSLNFQLLKSAAVFILVFLVTIINRKNIEKICRKRIYKRLYRYILLGTILRYY